MSLDGLSQVLANLNRAVVAMSTTAAGSSAARMAEEVVKDMRSAAPRGSTGRLQDEIKAVGMGGEREIRAVFYWHMVEFGTSHSRAQPFARPALHKLRQRYGDVVRQEFKSKVPHLQ